MTAVQKLGTIANQALLYPMLPQKLSEGELGIIAGGQFGFDLLAGQLYPDMAQILGRFGGSRFDSAMKAKIQTWLHGWVEPPEHYVVHHPFFGSGQWWRIFRTTMFLAQDLEEAHEAARTLPPLDLESKYAWALGLDARERFDSHREWWEAVLATIRMGSWHLAIYSPRYQAFISPFVLDSEDSGGEVIKDLQSEFPKPTFRLFTTEDAGFGVFDFSQMIYSGAYIEVMGDLIPAPPFGRPWGQGVVLNNHTGEEQVITGLIHAWTDPFGREQRRVCRVAEEPEISGVSIDGPDPFRMVQALYAVTGWLPKGVAADLMHPDRLTDLVESCPFLSGASGDAPLLMPKKVFLDSILLHPALVPVYGKVISLSVE